MNITGLLAPNFSNIVVNLNFSSEESVKSMNVPNGHTHAQNTLPNIIVTAIKTSAGTKILRSVERNTGERRDGLAKIVCNGPSMHATGAGTLGIHIHTPIIAIPTRVSTTNKMKKKI